MIEYNQDRDNDGTRDIYEGHYANEYGNQFFGYNPNPEKKEQKDDSNKEKRPFGFFSDLKTIWGSTISEPSQSFFKKAAVAILALSLLATPGGQVVLVAGAVAASGWAAWRYTHRNDHNKDNTPDENTERKSYVEKPKDVEKTRGLDKELRKSRVYVMGKTQTEPMKNQEMNVNDSVKMEANSNSIDQTKQNNNNMDKRTDDIRRPISRAVDNFNQTNIGKALKNIRSRPFGKWATNLGLMAAGIGVALIPVVGLTLLGSAALFGGGAWLLWKQEQKDLNPPARVFVEPPSNLNNEPKATNEDTKGMGKEKGREKEMPKEPAKEQARSTEPAKEGSSFHERRANKHRSKTQSHDYTSKTHEQSQPKVNITNEKHSKNTGRTM